MNDIMTIVATQRDGTDTRTLTLTIRRMLNGDPRTFDAKGAVREAVHEYLCTKDGKAVYDHNCESFNWADFESDVPNEICRRHGFEKIESSVSEIQVDWDEHLADDEALRAFWEKEENAKRGGLDT